MAVTYVVQQGPSATGPWTAVTGSPFSSADCTISGETPNTSYYVQITAQDLVLGISSTPAVFGPYTTLPTSAESPAGTTVTTVGPSINASPTPGSAGQGNIITITSGGQIALNGTTLGGANVTELYYTGASAGANGATSHTAYQENNAGNWYGPIVASGTGTQIAGSPIPAGPAIAISTIGTQTTNTPFSVSGTLSGYTSAPTLLYNDNGGTFGVLPVSNTVSATSFTFTHPSITAAETAATVAVEDANNTSVNATSNAYAVQAVIVGAPGPPTAAASPSQTVSTITFSWAPPTTGGALNNGIYQVLYKTVAASSYTNGATVPYITPGSGSFSALGGAWSVSSGGVIAFTGSGGPGLSSGVTMMVLVAGTVWQFNGTNWYGTTTPGSWPLGGNSTSPLSVIITGLANPQSYNIEVEVSNTTGQGIPCAPITAATSATSQNFTVSQGKIIGLDGNPFIAKGICMTDTSIVSASQAIASFPDLNVVNLALGAESGGGYTTAMSNASIFSWVNDAVSRGLNVILSDYVPGQPPARSGTDLTNCANWYAALASNYVGNPHVWWMTSNEVTGSTDASWTAIYNAIRGTGNASLIWLEYQYGNIGTSFGASASTIVNWTGVGLCVHSYEIQGISTLAQADSTKASQISSSQLGPSKDSTILPVFMGEGGNSSGGTSVNPPSDPFVNGVYISCQATDDLCTNAGQGTFCGYTMWVWAYGGPSPSGYYGTSDNLIVAGGANFGLTTYGQQINNNIRARPPGG